jgi:hypothetical protein
MGEIKKSEIIEVDCPFYQATGARCALTKWIRRFERCSMEPCKVLDPVTVKRAGEQLKL